MGTLTLLHCPLLLAPAPATQGKPFLDCINNVSHVGHAHPRVAQALAAQLATLNTNSRYLHPGLGDYGEALVALTPAPLEVR